MIMKNMKTPATSGTCYRTPFTASIILGVAALLAGCQTPSPPDNPDQIALRHCQAELVSVNRAAQFCDDSLLSTQARLDSARNSRLRIHDEHQALEREHLQLRNEYQQLDSGHRKLVDEHEGLRQTLDQERATSEKMREILRQLEEEIEGQSLLLHTPEQLEALEKREMARLRKYREAERNLDREASRERSSILSLLFPDESSVSIDWDPEYLQRRIAEVETNIRLIRLSRMLIARGATRVEDIL